MTTTKFSILNQSLGKLDKDYISSFEDASKEAEASATVYSTVKRSELSSFHWLFATVPVELNQDAESPTSTPYRYSYTEPGDILKIVTLQDASGSTLDYKIRGNKFLTDASKVYLTYIADISEESLPDYFVDMLVARLAFELCLPLSGDKELYVLLQKEYAAKKQVAKKTDRFGQPTVKLISSSPWAYR